MLSNPDLYELSTDVNQVLLKAKSLLGLNMLRFKHLVDASEKKFDCTYARLTRRHFSEQKQTELSLLKAYRDSIDALLSKASAMQDEEEQLCD
jgi:hypothetical protein